MKKLLIIFLLMAALLLLLAACDSGVPADTTAEDTTIAAEVTDAPAETPAETPTEAPTEPETETEEETTVKVIYETVQNPVAPAGADPWVVRHGDKYYYCYSSPVWFFGGVGVNEIPSLDKVTTEGGSQVYTAPTEEGADLSHSFEYWAPELHYIQGEWYIYVACDDGHNETHRMYVLKGTTQNPTDPFEYVGQITDPSNKWAIDGSVMEIGGELYFVWSGWEGDVNVAQHIYIAHMSNPWTIDSERVMISTPEYFWEKIGEPLINEGPTVLQHDGKTFLTYSASGSWTDDYCLGMLTLVGEDPMDPASWKKSESPVFEKRWAVCYGPGHASFTTAVDGSVWMIQRWGTGK